MVARRNPDLGYERLILVAGNESQRMLLQVHEQVSFKRGIVLRSPPRFMRIMDHIPSESDFVAGRSVTLPRVEACG
jgi:hypothetical protein